MLDLWHAKRERSNLIPCQMLNFGLVHNSIQGESDTVSLRDIDRVEKFSSPLLKWLVLLLDLVSSKKASASLVENYCKGNT